MVSLYRFAGLVFLFLLAGAIGGCGLQPGTTTITFAGGKNSPPPIEASESATYALYASNSGNALYTVFLKRGEEYGFRKAADGSVVAFARDREIPLQNWLATSYFWKQRGK